MNLFGFIYPKPFAALRAARLYAASVMLLCTIAGAQEAGVVKASECRPEVLRRPTLSAMSVRGELSGFDPCHASVTFNVPQSPEPPSLVIAVHGGGGRMDADAITRQFGARGMATLIFDAYRHNGLPMRMSNASRQMVLYKVALQAYQWALTRQDINTRSIYLYGISNGASVVLNLAAVVDPRHVKGVFSEAPTPVGIGYPWEIQVPVLIAFGRLDDLGAKVGSRRWLISDPCRFSVRFPEAPRGTSEHCSETNPNSSMLTTLQWAEKVKTGSGASVTINYFDGVAHGAFLGPLTIQTAQQFASARGFQMPSDMGWSEGATPEGQQALLDAALRFFGLPGAVPR